MSKEGEEGEENVYHKSAREELLDDDELSPGEEAFMKGYDEAEEEEDEEEKKEDDE